MTTQYNTIHEMLDAVYGAGTSNQIAKADAPILTTTSGYFNRVFGAMAFQQINQEANAFGILPKYPWQHSGYRAITADAGASADGGYAEASGLSDAIKPTVVQISVTAKEVEHNFIVSKKHDNLSRAGDDVFGSFEQARPIMASKHAKAINQQLLLDGDTLAGTRFESIDRVTASHAYATAVSWTTGDVNIYGINRSANAWADAVVSHNSGTDRQFTLDLLDDVLGVLEAKGARTNIILTGSDTKRRIIALARNSMRYQGSIKEIQVQWGINGVQTDEGINFGHKVASWEYIPIFVSQSVPKDTISRIYLLDTTEQEGTGIPRLGIAILNPISYYEARADDGAGISANNGYKHRGFFYTSGELVCTFFAGQGSIRDLK